MTTINDPGQQSPTDPMPGSRSLRRSSTDRIISGVAGGLGEYFAVDAVLFRVLFAVLAFFGGVGLLAYAVAWFLIPEPEVGVSALDKAIDRLRRRRVPPWLVIVGVALVSWIVWFSWWVPGPTFPAMVLLVIVALVFAHRMAHQTLPPALPAETRYGPVAMGGEQPAGSDEAIADTEARWPFGEVPGSAAPVPPLVPPLSDTRRSMQAWLSEASEARRIRLRRRRPIKIGVALALILGWAVVGILDAVNRVPFPVYLWVGLAILGAGLLVSVVSRRLMLSLLIPAAMLAVLAVGLGGTRASLRDGSGQIGWMPTSTAQLTDQHQFAGQTTLDLSALQLVDRPTSITVTQAVGEVVIRIPAGLNASVISDVHLGQIQNGQSRLAGQSVNGANVHLELNAPAGTPGPLLTIKVKLAVGQVEVDRAS